MSARALVSIIAWLAALVGVSIAWHARFIAPYRPRVQHVMVSLPRRHHNLAGLVIAYVADTHVGPHFAGSDLEPVVRHLEAIGPDLVLFGGDYICESPRFMAETAPMLGRMAATGRLGALAVLGNHDLANLRERVQPPLEAEGIRVLANEATRVETGRGELWIVGIDDGLIGNVDIAAAFGEVPPDAAAICLWHEPDRVEESAPFGAFLQLSGHSHGGQVRIPGIGPIATPVLGQEYVRGRYQVGDMELYVSSGLGVYRPPVRFNCPPELTVVRLID